MLFRPTFAPSQGQPCGRLFNSKYKEDMKATFNFNVQIDGSKSVITMDGDNIKDLDMDTLVTLGKLFQGIQTKVNQTLEKLHTGKPDSDEVAPPSEKPDDTGA